MSDVRLEYPRELTRDLVPEERLALVTASGQGSAADAAELLTALFGSASERGFSKEMHIAYRTDGIDGAGTPEDPRDGSTATKFKAAFDDATQSTLIVIGPGTFAIPVALLGGSSDGLRLKFGQTVRGSGIDVTVLAVETDVATDFQYALYGAASIDDVTIEDMTIDCNWANNFAANEKTHAVRLQGDNCTIRRVHAKNFGGDLNNSQESFPLSIANNDGVTAVMNGLIENCRVTDPVAGSGNSAPYATGLMIQGSGFIRNNYVNIPGASNCFGVALSLRFDNQLWIENNYFDQCFAGANGDSFTGNRFVLRRNIFDRCNRGILLNYGAGENLTDADISENLFLLPASGAATGGSSIRAVGGSSAAGTLRFDNNTILSYDGATTISQGGPYFGLISHVRAAGNKFDQYVGFTSTGTQTSVDATTIGPNYDLDGAQIFTMNCTDDATLRVHDTGDASINGTSLANALARANGATPNGSASSATNMFTVQVDAGDFNLASVATLYDYLVIRGASRRGTRIRSSAGAALQYNASRNKIDFVDLTLCGDGGEALTHSPTDTNSGGEFYNVHFTEINSGTPFQNGSANIPTSFTRCTADVTLNGASSNMVFTGTATDCDFPAGFFSDLNGATVRRCVFGADGVTVSGLQEIRGNTRFEQCEFYGDGVVTCTGAANFQHCIVELDSGGAGQCLTVFAASKVGHCIVRNLNGSATESVDTAAASNCSVYMSSLSHAVGANITNDVGTPNNVVDTDV